MMRFEYRTIGDWTEPEPDESVEVMTRAVNLGDVCERIEHFLLACGFALGDAHIGLVEEDGAPFGYKRDEITGGDVKYGGDLEDCDHAEMHTPAMQSSPKCQPGPRVDCRYPSSNVPQSADAYEEVQTSCNTTPKAVTLALHWVDEHPDEDMDVLAAAVRELAWALSELDVNDNPYSMCETADRWTEAHQLSRAVMEDTP